MTWEVIAEQAKVSLTWASHQPLLFSWMKT